MRFRYAFEDGKHLVQTRDDAGDWLESRSYPSQDAAEAVARKGEEMQADSIADVEKALTGPKGTVHHGVAPKAKAEMKAEDLPGETVTSGTVDDPADKGKAADDPVPPKPKARKPVVKASAKATRGSKPRK